MQLTLYHASPTRSHLIRFVLEEARLPHELVRVDIATGAHKRAPYAGDIHPHGLLPALAIDGTPIIEAVAIAMFLADLAPERGLAPTVGTLDRARYYQWCVYAVTTELVALSKIAMNTLFLPEPMRRPELVEEGRAQFATVAPVIAKAATPYLLGDHFTTADALVGGSLWLADMVGELPKYPELHPYYARISSRDAFRRAFAD